METHLSKGKYSLVCVAHPDDETLFFGGLILKLVREKTPVHIVCTTSDGNLDRKRQFNEACDKMGMVSRQWLGLLDRYDQRLPLDELMKNLKSLPEPEAIYTHGPTGEYGHPHHQDVSYAVHHAFAGHKKVFSVAYNCYPEIEVKLSQEDFRQKIEILTQIYSSETQRFMNLIPSTFAEGFVRLDLAEVDSVYAYLAQDKDLDTSKLKAYQGVADYLPHLRQLPRPF